MRRAVISTILVLAMLINTMTVCVFGETPDSPEATSNGIFFYDEKDFGDLFGGKELTPYYSEDDYYKFDFEFDENVTEYEFTYDDFYDEIYFSYDEDKYSSVTVEVDGVPVTAGRYNGKPEFAIVLGNGVPTVVEVTTTAPESEKQTYTITINTEKFEYLTSSDRPALSGTFIQPVTSGFSRYTDTQWDTHLTMLKNAGVDTIIVQWMGRTDANGRITQAYYESARAESQGTLPSSYNNTKFMIDRLLKSATKYKMKVFIGSTIEEDGWWAAAWRGDTWRATQNNIGNIMLKEVYDKYKATYPEAFAGWYWAWEMYTNVLPGDNVEWADMFSSNTLWLDEFDEYHMPMLISPFHSQYMGRTPKDAKEQWEDFFERAHWRDGDIYCGQDSVGAGSGRASFAKDNALLKAMKTAADNAPVDIQFWVNAENFTENGETWAITPAPVSRFAKQLEIAGKYTENIISFSFSEYYDGTATGTGSTAVAKRQGYSDYVNYAALSVARKLINGAEFAAVKQSDANTQGKLETIALNLVTPLTSNGVGAEINTVGFTPAATGSDGSYVFTVTLSRSGEEDIETMAKTIVITAEALSSNATLSFMQIMDSGSTEYPMTPASYSSTVYSYTAQVPRTQTHVYVNAVPVTGASWTYSATNGATVTNSGWLDVTLPTNGDNTTVTMVVTAEDKVTQNTYTVVIDRSVAAPSNDTAINRITVNGTNITVGTGVTSVSYALPSGMALSYLRPDLFSVRFTTPANGAVLTSVTPSADKTSWVLLVTASDGTTTKEYTVNITMTDAVAVAAAKAAIMMEMIVIPVSAQTSDETKVAYVQQKVNELLPSSAYGSLVATVSLVDSVYTVALSRGSASDTAKLYYVTEEGSASKKPVVSGDFIQSWLAAEFTLADWDAHMKALKSAGVDKLVLQSILETSGGKYIATYYPTTVPDKITKYTKAATYEADSNVNMLKYALDAAKANGIKIFVGGSADEGWWNGSNYASGTLKTLCDDHAEIGNLVYKEIWDLYKADYPDTLYGWYWWWEMYSSNSISTASNQAWADMFNTNLDFLTALDTEKAYEPMPMLISPFYSAGTAAQALSQWTTFFANAHWRDGDIFCAQDSVGAKNISLLVDEQQIAALKEAASTKPGVKFWINVEGFNTNYQTAPVARFIQQMNIAGRYADTLITFSYSHYYVPKIVGTDEYDNAYKEYAGLPTGGYVDVTGVSLDKDELELTVDDAVALTATVAPDNATSKALTWTSSDDGIAAVDNIGNVTAISPGTATITVKTLDGGFEAACTVTVKAKFVPVESVKIDGAAIQQVRIRNTKKFTATVNPTNATDQSLTWESSNEKIFTVEDGLVKGVGTGSAKLIVTCGGKTSFIMVQVTA